MLRVCVAALSGLLAVVAWGGVEEEAEFDVLDSTTARAP
jgi:hypothetical protein